MHKILAITSIVPAILGAIAVAFVYLSLWTEGFSGGSGLMIIGFEHYGFLLSFIAFSLSTMAYMVSNRNNQPVYSFNGVTIVLSLLSLAALMLGLGFL